ncbi:MAG: class I SAM-dependent methyltransferase [Treponema sp.]|nr:class I SAM-dependent methyltransferase [Treponema sp.]
MKDTVKQNDTGFTPQPLAGTKKREWFENEEFWQNYGPIMFDSNRWAEAPTVADDICKIAGLGKKSSILDAGCGPGRIAIELALRGLSVTGVDLIQSELDAAKESADDEGVHLNLVKADLRTYTSKKKFDAAINLYTSFGYCDTIEEDISILQHIAKTIKDNGWFIMESTSREIAIKYFTEGEWFERANKTVLTQFSVEGAWEGLRSKWILIDNHTGQRIEHEFVQRLYSAVELKRILITACKFKSAEIYGDFDFSPYNQNARTMVIIARK